MSSFILVMDEHFAKILIVCFEGKAEIIIR